MSKLNNFCYQVLKQSKWQITSAVLRQNYLTMVLASMVFHYLANHISEHNSYRYIVKIPEGYPLEAAGPVFCAGITMYSPLAYWNVRSIGNIL